jgi:hypothetical protein
MGVRVQCKSAGLDSFLGCDGTGDRWKHVDGTCAGAFIRIPNLKLEFKPATCQRGAAARVDQLDPARADRERPAWRGNRSSARERADTGRAPHGESRQAEQPEARQPQNQRSPLDCQRGSYASTSVLRRAAERALLTAAVSTRS